MLCELNVMKSKGFVCLCKFNPFLSRNAFLLMTSLIFVLSCHLYEKQIISSRLSYELRLAQENKVINKLLINFQDENYDRYFFTDYFKPITDIGVFKTLQFVSEKNGQIMHSNLTSGSNTESFDFRNRQWYQCAKAMVSNDNYCLSEPYIDYWPPHRMTITYSYPIYNGMELLGVGLHDIYIDDLYRNLFINKFESMSSGGDIISKMKPFKVFILTASLYLFLVVVFKCFSHVKVRVSDFLFKDELTGLPTRRSLKYFQFSTSVKAICLVDIDFFKNINDTFGHDIGDMCLSEVSNLIKKNIRKTDALYRWGGEEFLLIMADKDFEFVLERLRTIVNDTKLKLIDQNITITIGFKEYKYGDDIIDVIKKADRALYIGKNEGRNRVVKYS
ncbi:sensor domain-containing diguanylate cyclase [Vibrio vulnificus]|uniref:sensor domain-containing diguanylate cyclase n=1 Tax=Vibrio vulnificus TaxID=672 RepID=UPI003EDB4D2E